MAYSGLLGGMALHCVTQSALSSENEQFPINHGRFQIKHGRFLVKQGRFSSGGLLSQRRRSHAAPRVATLISLGDGPGVEEGEGGSPGAGGGGTGRRGRVDGSGGSPGDDMISFGGSAGCKWRQ
jgi:hypothetical protein